MLVRLPFQEWRQLDSSRIDQGAGKMDLVMSTTNGHARAPTALYYPEPVPDTQCVSKLCALNHCLECATPRVIVHIDSQVLKTADLGEMWQLHPQPRFRIIRVSSFILHFSNDGKTTPGIRDRQR